MFAKRSAGKPVLVADIGEGSIGVSRVVLAPDAVEVTHALRTTLSIEERTAEQGTAVAIQTVEDLCGKLLKVRSNTEPDTVYIEAIHVVVRAPWTQFRTARSEEILTKPRIVAADWIAATGKKALAEPANLNRSSILEAGVLQVFLNGYPSANPIGKSAQSLSVVAYESDIDLKLKSAAEEMFGKLLSGRTIVFHSGMRALLAVMHEHFSDLQRYVIVDVGGTESSCAVVRKDSVTQYAAAHEGLLTILKRLSQGGLPDDTLSMLRMLAADTCSTAACASMKESLAKAEPELVRAFGDMFGSLAGTRRLPNACILISPAELTPWLQSFFERIDFAQFTATTQPFSVQVLSAENLHTVHWPVGVTPDPGLGIVASSVNILAREGRF